MQAYITIITAAYNAESSLGQMLDSLATQTYRNFELIIQDGASSDNTVELAYSYKAKIPGLIINSQADNGIYDAWNKALSKAKGKWIIFLGDGDILVSPNTLEQAASYLANAPTETLFAIGGLKQILENGQIIGINNSNPQFITKKLTYKMPAHFPGIFFSYKIFDNCSFDTNFKIAGDYELFIRIWNENVALEIPITITQMLVGGVSTMAENRLKLLKEEILISNLYFNGKKLFHRYFKAYFQNSLYWLLGQRSNIIINKLRYLKFKLTKLKKN